MLYIEREILKNMMRALNIILIPPFKYSHYSYFHCLYLKGSSWCLVLFCIIDSLSNVMVCLFHFNTLTPFLKSKSPKICSLLANTLSLTFIITRKRF